MFRLFATVLVAAFATLHTVPGNAETVCGDHAKFLTYLGDAYSEQPVALGITAGGAFIEVLTSTSGSWTILITYPSGDTCTAASGENWEMLPVVASGPTS